MKRWLKSSTVFVSTLVLSLAACDGSHEREDEHGGDCGEEREIVEVIRCPTPVIEVVGDEDVGPLSLLRLDGRASHGVDVQVTEWSWSVEQPGGGVAQLQPSPFVATPRFVPGIAGTYIFGLEVRDALGTWSCDPVFRTIVVEGGAWDRPSSLDRQTPLEAGDDKPVSVQELLRTERADFHPR